MVLVVVRGAGVEVPQQRWVLEPSLISRYSPGRHPSVRFVKILALQYVLLPTPAPAHNQSQQNIHFCHSFTCWYCITVITAVSPFALTTHMDTITVHLQLLGGYSCNILCSYKPCTCVLHHFPWKSSQQQSQQLYEIQQSASLSSRHSVQVTPLQLNGKMQGLPVSGPDSVTQLLPPVNSEYNCVFASDCPKDV